MEFDMFAVLLSEDEILREALQEIWEMGQEPYPARISNSAQKIQRIFEVVDKAVADLDVLAERRRSDQTNL